MSYRIAAPDEYLAITGMNIKNVLITKTAWVWPFQKCTRFSVQPHDYAMNLQAMTKEKLQFLLPVVFTIGPDVNARGANSRSITEARGGEHANDEDRGDALMKYAMLLADSSENQKGTQYLEGIVKGIIEGETRVLVSSMTMEEIFTEREEFKRRIFRNIQGELDQFGLKIYNANVKELKDAVGSTYFQSLSQKAHEGATNQARIDVADAQLRGNVGEADRRGQQERQIAKINAETAVQKTDRDIERATAEANLATQKTNLQRDVDISRIQASRATESKDEDLKRDVEVKRAAAELERLRARDVVRATIDREAKQQAADAKAYEIEAEAKAQFEQANMIADANLQKQLREAEGITAMAEAYGKLGQAFGGPDNLLRYMMIEKGTYIELAKANAAAVQGMQPKISVWNTGSESGSGAGGSGSGQDSAATMRNIYQLLPPLMSTIHDQTGITLPEWQFGKLPSNEVVRHDKHNDNASAASNGN
ncbi:putative flotillin domain-containing protein [Rosellinia necatrix]|uniref:Putative flotillin domain-containing protein n=1 Tax=Rosellinia necatrix TaxID=77044 RepID=A0A1S7UKU9_ROSNE|nr:putative flotillin domain-containing protein [Rosellinia necatrix]